MQYRWKCAPLAHSAVCPLAGQLPTGARNRTVRRRGTYPDVYFGPVILLPFKELRGGIGRAATPRLQKLPGSEEVAEAEV